MSLQQFAFMFTFIYVTYSFMLTFIYNTYSFMLTFIYNTYSFMLTFIYVTYSFMLTFIYNTYSFMLTFIYVTYSFYVNLHQHQARDLQCLPQRHSSEKCCHFSKTRDWGLQVASAAFRMTFQNHTQQIRYGANALNTTPWQTCICIYLF